MSLPRELAFLTYSPLSLPWKRRDLDKREGRERETEGQIAGEVYSATQYKVQLEIYLGNGTFSILETGLAGSLA